ncbi:MAG: hypothetical protein ACP5QG_05430 [candidate division WOR-3 bacterium]
MTGLLISLVLGASSSALDFTLKDTDGNDVKLSNIASRGPALEIGG